MNACHSGDSSAPRNSPAYRILARVRAEEGGAGAAGRRAATGRTRAAGTASSIAMTVAAPTRPCRTRRGARCAS
jgi:hypothetical protein